MKINLLKKEKNNTSTSSLSAGRGSILPLKHKGSQRGFEQNPSYTFPYALREGQTGRSMVEMLGVLAVMGVLSVAGIAGYNSAMNRYKANTLISEAQRRAVIVANQIGFQGREPSLAEFNPPNQTSGGTIEDVTTEGLYKQFGIEVSGVTKPVCENILNTLGEATPIRRLSKTDTPRTPITTCEDTNSFLFIYNDDMQGATSDTEYAIDDSSCKSVCGVFNPETHLCDESDCEIPTNVCTLDTDCNSENECMVCDTTSGQCKNGCERVEYLESTGTQYIKTDYTLTSNTKIDILFSPNQQRTLNLWVIGSLVAENKLTGVRISSDTVIEGHINSIKSPQITGSNIGNKYRAVMDGKWTVNNEQGTSVISSAGLSPLILFGWNSSTRENTYASLGLCACKIYYCKIYDNGVQVRDFIPVLSPETSLYAGQPCMLDRVTKKLFCNAGAGDDFLTN